MKSLIINLIVLKSTVNFKKLLTLQLLSATTGEIKDF